jgi:hypothetical protein
MSESPYARPVEELIDGARVPVSEQIEEQTEPRLGLPDWSSGGGPYADGMGGDADGD